MTFQGYNNQLTQMFAKFGYTETPITHSQIIRLYAMGADLDKAYGVGCDVAAGFEFLESVSTSEYLVIWRSDGDDYIHTTVLLLDDIDPVTIGPEQWVAKAHMFENADSDEEDGYMEPNMLPSATGYDLIAVMRGPVSYIF